MSAPPATTPASGLQTPIEVRFRLGWQEFYAAERFLAACNRRTPAERVVAPTLALAGLIAAATSGELWPLVAAVALGAALLLAAPRLRRRKMRSRWAREPFHHQEHAIAFDSEGVRYTQGQIVSRYPWHFYARILESNDAFLLICGEDVINLIPKRAFESAQAVDAFRALAAEKLGQAASE